MSWLSRSRGRLAGAVAVAVVAGAGGGLLLAHAAAPGPPPLSRVERSALSAAANPEIDTGTALPGNPAPGFSLTDQNGRRTTLAQFRGKVVALAFVDARCTTICPITTQGMVAALGLLGRRAADVQLLGIDANPLAHAVPDVRAYTVAHGMTGQWRFLTGPLPALERVWRAYHVFVAAIHGNIDHEPIVELIDPQGRARTVYVTQMYYAGVQQQAQVLAQGMAALLPGHPRVAQTVPLRLRPRTGPATPGTLPVVGGTGIGTRLALGAGHPHLVVFFASWLSEGSDPAAELVALNRYAALARARGWPSPVAVDLAATEPSPTALGALLARVSGRLAYPVVVDRTGQLADGYGAQDMPWLALTDAAGHQLWHHDGWPSPGSLAAAVTAALRRATAASPAG